MRNELHVSSAAARARCDTHSDVAFNPKCLGTLSATTTVTSKFNMSAFDSVQEACSSSLKLSEYHDLPETHQTMLPKTDRT